MENVSASAAPDDFIDIACLNYLDLRMLQQDEIQCLSHICGDVPARLQDLVDVIVDKSMFNESAGSRRQTYDRDRVPRNKQRHFLSKLSPAQLHYAAESAGRSHKDLLIHLCRKLKISEKGDRALYQVEGLQPSGMVVGGNRSMSLKRMARASACLAGPTDGVAAPPSKVSAEVLVNGKNVAMEVLHQSTKKLKTKEEARRRAAECQTRTVSQADKQAPRAIKVTWSGSAELVPSKEQLSSGGMRKVGRDVQSFDAGRIGAIGHSVEISEPSNVTSGVVTERPSEGTQLLSICSTCDKNFANVYSLKRHKLTTGHGLDRELIQSGLWKKREVVLNENELQCSCGNTYATPYTLRRHVMAKGHSFKLTSKPQEPSPIAVHVQKIKTDEAKDDNLTSKPLKKQKPEDHLPKRAWKSKTQQFKCRQCHRQFVRKKHYIRHMEMHYQKKKKKTVKFRHKLLKKQANGSNSKVKVKLGRPPKPKGDADIRLEKVGKKRKQEPASAGKQAKARKTEDMNEQMPAQAPSGKPQSFPCQECGRIFDEFFRYSGHLSMHAKLKKMLVSNTSSPTSAALKKNVRNLKEFSALGFRKLLSGKTGTYLSGLPAELLFSGSALAKKEEGKA